MAAEPFFVKICGITRVEDAILCVESRASAIGLNFVSSSKRRIDESRARHIVESVKGRIEVVAVVADLAIAELRRLRVSTGIDWLQLHGSESNDDLVAVLPNTLKAVGVSDVEDVRAARAYGGSRILLDAKVDGAVGGKGVVFDWSLVQGVATERSMILAGGLTPDNVAEAVRAVRPWGVDVASGVESSTGIKDPSKVRAFIDRARMAGAS